MTALAAWPNDRSSTRWQTVRLAMRLASRELRGGVRGFGVFIACIALGVMAIAGVGSVGGSLADGIAAAGQMILGGDLTFSLVQREANERERAFLDIHGAVSAVAMTRAMVRTSDGRSTLVELKAVDSAYPLYGAVTTQPVMPLAKVFAGNGNAFGAAAEPALLARLKLQPGDRVTIGNIAIELRALLTGEPDKLGSGLTLGPRLLIGEAALRASGLLQPGSLIRWQYRLRLPDRDASDSAVAAVEDQAQAQFPDAGWEIRTRAKASPQLERNIERFTQFLTLIGLATLLVGGIGVANAVAAHLARERDVIGTMKALGASGGTVFCIYCTQLLLVALLAALFGAVLGAALPFVIARGFGSVIPFPVNPSLYPGVLLLSLLYGLLTALAFALWPLGRLHDIPAAVLFRGQIAPERNWPRPAYLIATGAITVILAALAIEPSHDRRIAVGSVLAAVALFALLRFLARGVEWVARRLPRPSWTELRLAIGNIHRPGALTPSVILSLGLGLALLVAVTEVAGNLHRQLTAALPAKAPSFFFVDIPAAQGTRFDDFIRNAAPGSTLERVPMLRGRIVAANGIKADDLKPAERSRWVLRGDRGITYAATVPVGSRMVAGEWWKADYAGAPLVSLEDRTARDLNLKIGDSVTVNVLGRNVTARIANLRAVDWENLGINFVLVFSPGTFAGAPHSDIATLTFADGGTPAEEAAFLEALATTFPGITAVGVKDMLNTLDAMLRKLVLALGGASTVTLVAAVLVLGGAIAAGQRFRIYDAVLLKTYGATRGRVLLAYALEYILIAAIAALFGVALGSVAADIIVTRLMEFRFVWGAQGALAAACGAIIVTLVLGLIGTAAALGRKPAEVLRNL